MVTYSRRGRVGVRADTGGVVSDILAENIVGDGGVLVLSPSIKNIIGKKKV